MSAPALVLLAAGASRRYGRPKQLDPLGPGGETIMELTAQDAVAAGVGRIVLVVGEETGQEVLARTREAARRDGYADRVPVDAVRQQVDDLPGSDAACAAKLTGVPARRRSRTRPRRRPRTRPWGTAHALRAARSLLGGTGASVVVANADDWYGPGAIERVVRWAAENADATAGALVPYPLLVVLPPGVTSVNAPEAVSERPPATGSARCRTVAAAAKGVSRGLLRTDDEGRLADLVEHVHMRRDPSDPSSALGVAPDGTTVRAALDRLCSMNLWAFGPGIWDVLERGLPIFLASLDADAGVGGGGADDPGGRAADAAEWFLPKVVRDAVRSGDLAVRVLSPGERHLGVTHPEDRTRVRDALAAELGS